MRQSVPGLREDGRWSIAVSHISAAVAISVVAGLLLIAIATANGAQDAGGLGGDQPATRQAESADGPARTQALAGFGLLGIWLIAGAVLAARANPGRKLTFGQPPGTQPVHTNASPADESPNPQAATEGPL